MTRLKQRGITVHGQRTFLGDIQESRELLGSAMAGKTIIFVVDWRDSNIESQVLKYALMEPCGAGEKSGLVTTEDFLAKKPFTADVLILRSSRHFEQRTPELLGALESFRAANPGCAVILCAFTGSVVRAAGPLLQSGVVNCIDSYPPNDFELLRKAADVLSQLARQ